jgi:hypothetical protein
MVFQVPKERDVTNLEKRTRILQFVPERSTSQINTITRVTFVMKHVGKNTTSTAKINKRGTVARLKLLPDAHEVGRDTDLFVDVFFRVCSRPQLNKNVETQLCHSKLIWSPRRASGGYFAESQTKCSG